MAYEIGGRADKFGNRFEYNWVIHKLLDVVEERISYVLIEAIGDDEQGVDLWIGNIDGTREAQQCKARSGSDESWTYGAINDKGILLYWKKQLSRSKDISVSLVSPLSFTLFEDILSRARNTDIDNPNLFYEVQIAQSGVKTRNLFNNICQSMDINLGTVGGNELALDFFSRMHYRQTPDQELKEMALRRIDMLFTQDAKYVYNQFLGFIHTEDILGKKIDCMELHLFFQKNNIAYRNLQGDQTIWPRMMTLNKEYRKTFAKLSCGVLNREASDKCFKRIIEGKSIIIHGDAGMGKSGCTENIIDWCIANEIPYIAIKLDKHLPEFNSRKWGELLGLPASISHCINSVSLDRRAVIILDQLDALRWTQSKSSDAIAVCSEIIDEVSTINERRAIPISFVVVCRSYDIEHDISIKSLFSTDEAYEIEWEKICIDFLEEKTVAKIVGDSYRDMSPRMRQLLRIISNLYIWDHLNYRNLTNIETTTQLVSEWWNQILMNAHKTGISSQDLENIKKVMVDFCDQKGRLIVPKSLLREKGPALTYLESNGILWSDDSRVAFVHQSILDSFLSEMMIEKYYNGESIVGILGEKDKQTPNKRYQTQLCLQQLAGYQTDDLIDFGEKILLSGARSNIKYAFLEVLSQYSHPDATIKEYVTRKLECSQWKIPFVNTVIRGNSDFVRYLRKKDILDNWIQDENMRSYAIDLIASFAPEYNDSDVAFISKYALLEDSKSGWENCFYTSISDGSEKYFKLKLSYFTKHPELLNRIYDTKEMTSSKESRLLRIIALKLELQTKRHDIIINNRSGLLIENEEAFRIFDYNKYFEILFPFFPKPSNALSYSEWSSQNRHFQSMERICVNLIKRAARLMAQNDPIKLLEYYKPYMGIGNRFYNELILDSLNCFPDRYADYVLTYLCDSLECNSIEDTSGSNSKLTQAYAIVSRFSSLCSDEVFKKLEDRILKYQPSNMVSRYKERIEYNKATSKELGHVYWPYWGYYQLEMLPSLTKERMSKQALNTLSVLKRNMNINHSWYQLQKDSHTAGIVVSPLHNKTIPASAWKCILRNRKIGSQRHRHWKQEGKYYVESSIEEFANSFQNYTSNNPGEAIKLILGMKESIDEEYADSLYEGIAFSNQKSKYSVQDIEELFKRYRYDLKSFRARHMCKIVEVGRDDRWSESTYNMIRDIAINHRNPELDNPVIYSGDNKEVNTWDLHENNALNCVRGQAARTIAGLLWVHADLYEYFRQTIVKMSEDENPIIRYASLWCFSPILNIDRGWAVNHMIKVLAKDYRCLAANNMRWVICRYFNKYQDEIKNAISDCIQDKEDRLIREAGYLIAELYMINNLFDDYLMNPATIIDELKKYIIEMLILYLGVEKYKEKAKNTLCEFALVETNVENDTIWTRIFSQEIIDINEDKDFVLCILKSKISIFLIEEFCKYIERHHCAKEFSRELLDICKDAISQGTEYKATWGLEKIIIRTVISLYYNNLEGSNKEQKEILSQCLDMWDLMYEKDFGTARQLTRKLLEI